ncbi:hypothetical protein NIES2109_24660 [Nostoc sp. HK-01]|uniref:Uncharacterized protein n=2 Tax=Nostocales TaxID=1161 RepID=A0A1Z4GFH0_9CYAN|nr:hypothetical protein [Nostoc cycadae]BAY16255.1 hypothetical protein NIES21_20800 [Anabaenopsis circularis NIES-21]BBD59677.1 hypothetical protein NIES2109_24660 [Nostoc sp. HK-01]GBE92668.1 hypothetical protein NCWK1_2426 [Nostoc cycadae WK-1]
MMEQNDHQQRRAANQEFEQSLNQLEGILHDENLAENEATQAEEITDAELVDELGDIDLAAFEDAVADIEQYLQEKTK